MRRLAALLAVASVLVNAPAATAGEPPGSAVNPDTYSWTGTMIAAQIMDPWLDEAGATVPGTYITGGFRTHDWRWVSNNVPFDEEHEVCGWIAQVTAVAPGWTGTDWYVESCAPWTAMVFDDRLTTGELAATIEISGCTSWNADGSCATEGDWTLEVDATLTGTGEVTHDRYAESWGYRNVERAVGHYDIAQRNAIVTGSIVLVGEPPLGGAQWVGWLSRERGGGTVVIHPSNPE